CFPGTRVALLKELLEWATNLDTTASNIFWLSGLPQTGKSSIAMSFADWANEEGALGGGLFFRETEEKVHNLLSAIVNELASFNISIRESIVEALEKDENLMDKELEVQFRKLIVEPLRLANLNSSKVQKPILLVVDVLDRCEEEEAVELLKLFLTHLSGHDHSHVRILITSRP
ncbi:hypothetical protein SCHPADRAFT_800300, partial [Schizopora paradoxa]